MADYPQWRYSAIDPPFLVQNAGQVATLPGGYGTNATESAALIAPVAMIDGPFMAPVVVLPPVPSPTGKIKHRGEQ